MRSRVLLVEDFAPMREAVSRILAVECDLVGYDGDGRHALKTAIDERPDVIVLDISLPGISGMALLPLLRAAVPEVAVVMLTNHAEEEYVEEAMRRGAHGYVLKSDVQEALLPAVRLAGPPPIVMALPG